MDLANRTAQLQALTARLKLQLSHMNDGTTYTTVESQSGATAGQGTVIVSEVNILDAIINGATGAGGATQQGQIQSLVGQLAGQ